MKIITRSLLLLSLALAPWTQAQDFTPKIESRYILGSQRSSGLIFDSPGSRLHIDATKSTGGKMTIFGLTFTQDCTCTVLDDRTLGINKEKIVTRDSGGKTWVSRKAILNGQEIICFFPENEGKAPPKSADASTRYKWRGPDAGTPVSAEGIVVQDIIKGGQRYQGTKRAPGGKGMIPFVGDRQPIDNPGSKDIRIEIEPNAKSTVYAGLTFISPCVLEILDDGTLLADKADIKAKDGKGGEWQSQYCVLDGENVTAFFPKSPDSGDKPTHSSSLPSIPEREAWQSDWRTFIAELSLILDQAGGDKAKKEPAVPENLKGFVAPGYVIDAKAGPGSAQGRLFERFQGEVRWDGIIESLSLGGPKPQAYVKMPDANASASGTWQYPQSIRVVIAGSIDPSLKNGGKVQVTGRLQRPSDSAPFSGVLLVGSLVSINLVDGRIERAGIERQQATETEVGEAKPGDSSSVTRAKLLEILPGTWVETDKKNAVIMSHVFDVAGRRVNHGQQDLVTKAFTQGGESLRFLEDEDTGLKFPKKGTVVSFYPIRGVVAEPEKWLVLSASEEQIEYIRLPANSSQPETIKLKRSDKPGTPPSILDNSRPAASSEQSLVGVKSQHVYIKVRPDSTAANSAAVAFGDRLTVLDHAANWLKVRTAAGETGWLHKMIVCDEATLQARKASGRVPSAMLLVSGVNGEAGNIDILAGTLRTGAAGKGVVAEVGTCVVFARSPGLAKTEKFGIFKNAPILKHRADVTYYFDKEHGFQPLSPKEASFNSPSEMVAEDTDRARMPAVAVKDNWPAISGELRGSMEVRVRNPNEFSVKVGLRSGGNGKDFTVGANDVESVRVPNGRYDIYFQYSADPDGLYQGDSFTLQNNGVEIKIVKVVNGNYGIRKVR